MKVVYFLFSGRKLTIIKEVGARGDYDTINASMAEAEKVLQLSLTNMMTTPTISS